MTAIQGTNNSSNSPSLVYGACCQLFLSITFLVLGILGLQGAIPMAIGGAYAMIVIGSLGLFGSFIECCICCCVTTLVMSALTNSNT